MNLGLSQEHLCSYLQQKMSRSLMVMDEALLSPQVYDALLAHGYRRSGEYVYRPWCDDCRQCHAVRVPVRRFRPSRSQRRCGKVNQDLDVNWHPGELTEEQHALYLSYQDHRHADSSMAGASLAETEAFLLAGWSNVRFLEMRLNRELLAVAVTDFQPQSLSAVYTFFHPDMGRRSLGNYAVLQQILQARGLGKSWLYLGYWIPDCRKMAYKSVFRPLEVRRSMQEMQDEKWIEQC